MKLKTNMNKHKPIISCFVPKKIIFNFQNLFQELCEHGEKTELQDSRDPK